MTDSELTTLARKNAMIEYGEAMVRVRIILRTGGSKQELHDAEIDAFNKGNVAMKLAGAPEKKTA